jgi:preprotein translocase subunit SecE
VTDGKVVRVARKVIDEPSEDVVANARRDRADRRSPFARVAGFMRQVVVELRKVVTPTRQELISYTLVVLVFVVIMMLIVSGLDLVFGNLVGWVFGHGALTG